MVLYAFVVKGLLYRYAKFVCNRLKLVIFSPICTLKLHSSYRTHYIKNAKRFFGEYFPNYDFDYFFCESWLLYGENWQFMNSSSNILQFSTLFDLVYSVEDDRQAIERIFGKRKIIKSKYEEKTTLQRNAKRFMQNGGKLGVGIGILFKGDI